MRGKGPLSSCHGKDHANYFPVLLNKKANKTHKSSNVPRCWVAIDSSDIYFHQDYFFLQTAAAIGRNRSRDLFRPKTTAAIGRYRSGKSHLLLGKANQDGTTMLKGSLVSSSRGRRFLKNKYIIFLYYI